MQNQDAVARQYATANNLNTRVAFQQRFSQNKYGFSRWLMDQYAFPAGARVLELGCGTGSMWQNREDVISNFSELVLTDFSAGMLAEAQKTLSGISGVRFLQADIQNLPFADASYDFVIANMMLYHVPDMPKAVAEVRRVLRPGGTFACATYGEIGLVSCLVDLLRGLVEFRPMNTAFTLQNGDALLGTSFAQVEKREYPDSFVVDDADAIVQYLMSMTNMLVLENGEFPAERVRLALAERISTSGPLHIPKQYGTFLCG